MAKYSNKLHRALMKAQKCTLQFPKDAQPGKVRKLADAVYQMFSIFGRGQEAYNIVDGSSSLAKQLKTCTHGSLQWSANSCEKSRLILGLIVMSCFFEQSLTPCSYLLLLVHRI